MSDDTRPKYEALRERIERPLEFLVILAALATIPVVIAQERGDARVWVTLADWAVWLAFALEFGLMGLVAADRKKYTLHNVVGLAIVVFSFPLLPDLLALLRVVRVARLVRLFRLVRVVAALVRGMRKMRQSIGGQSVIYVGALTLVLAVTGAGLLVVLEPATVNDSFLDGLWWAMVTVSTVGYGDIAPQTLLGRLLAVVLMFCGLGLLSTLAATISAYFVGDEKDAKHEDLSAQLERIEAALEEIRANTRNTDGRD